ncbi:MAG: ribonuclease III [Rhodobiaceae bacterium]|nr:ribonuclease III [Rhodobiaceae bacterium]
MIRKIDNKLISNSINYTFIDQDNLKNALTHSSVSNTTFPSYERLEFLGDKVLGFVITDILYTRYPYASEGELSRRYSDLVNSEALVVVAKKINLGKFLLLGSGEERLGHRNKDTILEDACEALIGAIYIDGGLNEIKKFINNHWKDLIDNQQEVPIDPKTRLQEWCQAQTLGLPEYIEIDRTGPSHNPSFTISVVVKNFDKAIGTGSSKREAKRNAAINFLVREGVVSGN